MYIFFHSFGCRQLLKNNDKSVKYLMFLLLLITKSILTLFLLDCSKSKSKIKSYKKLEHQISKKYLSNFQDEWLADTQFY